MEEAQTCKKCHLAIVEDHAYELGDNRWHIHCFKCSNCDKTLGCNSHFLVLGNGNLICSACSYNCKQCGKKIDDLAILTGDQAYCLLCFKCRVCKLKIEDLRYARTLKGLFCMACHEELIAKKRKHDLKRKQLAQLALLLRPSPDTDLELTPGDLYSLRNASLSLMLNKLLPPHPPAPAELPLLSKPHTPLAQTQAPSHVQTQPAQPQPAQPAQPQNVPLGTANLSTQSLSQSFSLAQSIPPAPAMPPASPSGIPVPGLFPADVEQLPMLADVSAQEIEEVNDLDDELQLRRMRERLERRFNRLTGRDSDGAILDLIYSFSGPNTPSTVYTLTDRDAVALLLHISLRVDELDARALSTETVATKKKAHDTPTKNLFLLSPTQFHDCDFHRANPLASDPLANSFSHDDIVKPRLGASSPMAKQNRQARVVETSDDVPTAEISTDIKHAVPVLQPAVTTPKKSQMPQHQPVSSPPPRLALPEVPSTPRENGEPKGLGLENVELTRPQKLLNYPTPAVTNLEDTIPSAQSSHGSNESADTEVKMPSRKQSMRTKMLLKHKRSVSGGLSSGISGKFGFFKNKDDAPTREHTRNMLEGSLQGLAFTTPPLPFSSPMRHGTMREPHTRSTSDTQFLTLGDASFHKGELDLRSLKFEIYQLDNRRQNLLAENMRLNTDKNKLQEAIRALQRRLTLETQTHETLVRDVNELTAEKLRLRTENEKLKGENKHLADSSQRIRDHLKQEATPRHQVYESSEGYDSSSALESVVEEGAETQKATRLKFWRRPKVTISPSNNNVHGLQASQLPSISHSTLVGNGNGIPHSQSTQKLSQSYSTNAIQHPALQSTYENGDSGARKALSTFMSKSRSTAGLDAIANGQHGSGELFSSTNLKRTIHENANGQHSPGEAPLFSSTIQKRSIYENEKVPLIITKCLEEVEDRGLDIEGIYRLSGGNSAIVAIENAFAALPANPSQDKKYMQKLRDVMDGDINAVTSALKRYLRKLPDPLIPYSLYESYIKVGQSRAEAAERSSELAARVVNKLPPANKHALYLIGRHLDKVNSMHNVNRMNFKNLSVVFAPTIARDATGEKEMIDMAPRNDATELLFENFAQVFADYEA